MSQETIIKIKEIESLYREYCKESNINFSKDDFIEFLKFLEIDFYDWVRENLKYFAVNNEEFNKKINVRQVY